MGVINNRTGKLMTTDEIEAAFHEGKRAMSDLHERAVSDARRRHEILVEHVAFPSDVRSAAYTLRVLEAFEPMRAALDALEWVADGVDTGPYCMLCLWNKRMGHRPECIVGAALRAAREVSET